MGEDYERADVTVGEVKELERRAERAEAEMERLREIRTMQGIDLTKERALADRLAEALQESIAHGAKDCHGGCGRHTALTAYEEARRD